MVGAVATLSACASLAQDAPALLARPSAESHAELVQTISSALNVKTVTIAEDALTRENVLVIERTPARDAAGQRLSGRDFDKPEQFQLLRSGKRCVLLHIRTAKRYDLTNTPCTDL